jgi:hypothetical protein
MPSSNTTDYKQKGPKEMNQLTQPTKPNNRSLIRILCALCGLGVSILPTPAHADDTLFDNYGSYVNIEHQEGLDTDRVLIINQGHVFIGDTEENGYFNAYGINGSVWGSQTGAGQVIVLQNPDDVE